MVKPRFWIPVFIAVFSVTVSVPAAQEKPGEVVTVTAVEVPVRILQNRQFLSGLGKGDFEIFENGVRQEITGFEEISRTIAPGSTAIPGTPQAPQRRNFILIFNIFNFTDQIGEAIDYFFKEIYKPEDRIMVLVEDRILDVQSGPGAPDLAAGVKDALIKLKKISGFEFMRMFRELEMESNTLYAVLDQRTHPSALEAAAANKAGVAAQPSYDKNDNIWNDIKRFYFRYRRLWEDYRKRLLDIDLELYKTVVQKVGRMPGQKWAICFQQRDLFPILKNQGRLDREIEILVGQVIEPQWQVRARDIQADADDLRRSFDLTKALPAEALKELFTGNNITFHVLLMKSLSRAIAYDSQDLDLRDVQGEYEDSLRRISRSTGGLTVFSNEVLETLKQAAAKEDRYYLVVYQPKNKKGGIERKIDVKCGRPGAEVIALKKYVGAGAPSIEISGFQAKGRRIGFDVGKYGKSVLNWREVGQVLIKITVFDGESKKVFEESRGLELAKETTHLDLEFNKLPAGDHFLIIEAIDIVTGGKDVFSRPIVL
jgi:VWFA-related protein